MANDMQPLEHAASLGSPFLGFVLSKTGSKSQAGKKAKRPGPVLPVFESAEDNEPAEAASKHARLVQDDHETPATSASSHRKSPLEDVTTLRHEGETLAVAGRYSDALKRWNKALAVADAASVKQGMMVEIGRLCEASAQARMERDEYLDAIESAERAVEVSPGWAVAWQTLGRAQMGYGEPLAAVLSFEKALTVDLDFEEVRQDLLEARQAVAVLKDQGRTHARDAESREILAIGGVPTLQELADARDDRPPT
ncbi:hypothetical protein HKX48_006670 [Thoreauomyces humboldtii]|nr:hypothetical protein HKX48_006670 [Thoreauomyces humboldtii]